MPPAGLCLEWTGEQIRRQTEGMGQVERPTCPRCGAHLVLEPLPGGEGRRMFQCRKCDPQDPLKSDNVSRWIRSELRPPK
jgi:hypothetical protein